MQLMLINDKKIQRASLLLLGLFWSVAGFAQTGKQDSLHSLQDKRVMNQEQYTANPATLVQSRLPQYGFAGMHAGFSSGDYRRPMQAENIQSFMGETGGHRILKGWTYNGYFSYGKRYDRSVAWSGAMDPYEGNPFIWADSSTGDWERDEVRANIAIVAPQIRKFRFGLAIDYTISSGARDNDPRPFFRYRDVAVRPGLLYQISRNSEIGITGFTGFAKEEAEIGFFTRNSNVLLYRLRGYGTFSKAPFVSGERRRQEIRWQGSTHYSKRRKDLQFLLNAYVAHREDEVIEGVATTQTMGYFKGINFGGIASLYQGNAERGKSVAVNAFMHNGYADDMIFRAESASFSRQGVGIRASYWRSSANKSGLWQFTLHPTFSYYNNTDQGTRTLIDVSSAAIAAEIRYRKKLGGNLHFFATPAINYSLPVDDFYSSARPNLITEELVYPDYLFFATRTIGLNIQVGWELKPANSSVLHTVHLSTQNIWVAENKPINNRNQFGIIYAIIF